MSWPAGECKLPKELSSKNHIHKMVYQVKQRKHSLGDTTFF